jgi:hypothetical protein
VAEQDKVHVICYDMAITRSDFLRCLPAAVGGQSFRVDGEMIEPETQGQRERWSIRIRPLPPRRIALVSLERHEVEIRLAGYSDFDSVAFLKRFDRYFQRGGG